MPRIAINIVSLSLTLLFAHSGAGAAKAVACGDRVQGFNAYNEFEKNEETGKRSIVEKRSIFPIEDISPDSSFQGVVIKKSEDPNTKIEFEVRGKKKNSPVRVRKTFSFKDPKWAREEDKDYLATEEGLAQKLAPNYEEGVFIYRLKLNGNVLCESEPLPIGSEEQGD